MKAGAAFTRMPSDGRRLPILGHSVTVMIESGEAAGDCYAFAAETPPGGGVPPHVHDREDEIIHIGDGEFEVMTAGKVSRLGPGGVMYFRRNAPHAFKNVGNGVGRTFRVVTPGGNFSAFFDELGALPAGPPDMERVAAIFAKYKIDILPPA